MAFYKIFSPEQEKLLKKIIHGFILFGKYNMNHPDTFFMRVMIHFNKVSNDEPLRFGFNDNYLQVKEEFKNLIGEVIIDINSLNLKEEFKVKEKIFMVTSRIMQDAQKAEARHRRDLGDDY